MTDHATTPFGAMRRWLRRVAASAALALSFGSAQAYVLTMLPVDQTVGLGATASVSVTVADVLPIGLGNYSLDLVFNDAVLGFDHVVDAGALGFSFGLDSVAGSSRVSLSDFSLEAVDALLALQSDSMTLFTIVFDAIGVGTSALSAESVNLGDALGTDTATTMFGASITVAAGGGGEVPEPGLPSLLLLAFAAAVAARRRAPLTRPGRVR